ncbi:S-layer domain protein [Paenibacillus curdlanolyticus YK9]|uniref:S-layer domain protein n=1 Tax=Paenibacillus curdlanolyticus YK9 TaxID=717606 RepID=E0IBI1_9BACL|nr:S-layer homology domain-containing protein [Paenibacillus curdlanolyticus]EFM10061.1 S-layer domain protein [Paenibacillus curdlanolyticus YK9]
MQLKSKRSILLFALVLLMVITSFPAFPGGARTAFASANSSGSQNEWIRMKNSYTGKYLYETNGKVAYGSPVETDRASQWTVEDNGSTQRLKNRESGHYMSMANVASFGDPLEALPDSNGGNPLAGADWHVLDAPNPGLKVIQSAGDANLYIHVQDNTGYAQSSQIPPSWGTPQWAFEPVVDYVRLKNSYTGKYLFESSGKVAYGSPAEADPSSHWVVESSGATERIRNRESGHYMSMANVASFGDPVEALPLPANGGALAGADWHVLDASNPGLKVIQSADDANLYIHVQDNTGYAQSSQIPPNWGTPQWALESVEVKDAYNPNPSTGPQYVRIKNDYLGLYMMEDNGQLLYGNATASDQTAQWEIVKEQGYQRIVNRATGHAVSLAGVASDKVAVAVETADPDAQAQRWVIDNLSTEGAKLIHTTVDPADGQYLHVEKKLGFVQFGTVPPSWGSPRWLFLPVTDDGPHYVRLKNRYTGKYLFEEPGTGAAAGSGKVAYGDPDVSDGLSHWLLEDGGNGSVRIRNRVTGHAMANEHLAGFGDPLESIVVEDGWSSAKWAVSEPAPGFFVFTNKYKTNETIHVQDATGYAQSSGVPADWWSAQWSQEAAPDALPVAIPQGYVRVKSAGSDAYLYENERGVVLYGTPEEKDARSHWTIAALGDGYALVNRATNDRITVGAGASMQATPALNGDPSQKWYVEQAPNAGRVLLRSALQPKQYLHMMDGTGFAQLGLRSIESAALQWILADAPADSFVPDLAGAAEPIQMERLSDARHYKLANAAAGRLLLDNGGTPALAAAGSSPGGDWQLQDENGYKLLRSLSSGKYLAVDSSGNVELLSLAEGTPAPLAASWQLTPRSGQLVLASAALPGKLLQAGGGMPQLASGNAAMPTDAQLWTATAVAAVAAYEAEQAFIAGGAKAGSGVKAASAGRYVAGFEQAGAEVVFAIYAEQAGMYETGFRYANGQSSSASLALQVNGEQAAAVAFAASGGWDSWQEQTVQLHLRQGMNTVAVSSAAAAAGDVLYLDQLKVKGIVANAYRGASLAYDSYEAEHMATNGVVIGPDRTYKQPASEASGRQAVTLTAAGDYVAFKLNRPANRLTIRYSIPDSADGAGLQANVGLSVNGSSKPDVVLSSKHAWVYGTYPWSNNPNDGDAHRFYDETSVDTGALAAGDTVRLEKLAGTAAATVIIDVVEAEWADAPYAKPADFVSIIDYGAAADDGQDDTAAIQAAIAAAKAEGKGGVWLPAGVFNLTDGPIALANITIRGAGMWQTTIAGAGFLGKGSSIRVFDLAIDGGVTGRHDDQAESGFDGTFGKGSTIQHVRISHTKAGIWVTAQEVNGQTMPTTGLYIADVRIRDTYADGVNFSTGTMGSMVEQSQLRNTGDDSMAIWSNGTPVTGNTFRFNTVELPWLSNNIAVYGGGDNHVTDNIASDTVAFGGGISVSTRHNPTPFTGTTTVERNTLERTGGREHNWPADIGALFLYTSDIAMNGDIRITNNLIHDSTNQGISFLGEKPVAGLVLAGNVVDGTGSWGVNGAGNITGSALFGNTTVRNAGVGNAFNGAGGLAWRTVDSGLAYVKPPFAVQVDGVAASPYRIAAGTEAQGAVWSGSPATLAASGAAWSSSDATIAAVDSTGKITAKRHGQAILTVQYGGETRDFTLVVEDTTAPVWPTGAKLAVSGVSDSKVTLNWPAAQDNGTVNAYRVDWGSGSKMVAGNVYELTVSGLTPGGVYTFKVNAVDEAGLWTAEALSSDYTLPSGGGSGGSGQPAGPSGSGSGTSVGCVADTAKGNVLMAAASVRASHEAVVQPDVLTAALDRIGEGQCSTLAVHSGSDQASVTFVLPAGPIAAAAADLAHGVLTFHHQGATYQLPLERAVELLQGAASGELRITIQQLERQAAEGLFHGAAGVWKSGAYSFKLEVSSGGSVTIAAAVDGYVRGSLIIDRSIDPIHATVVVYDEQTGKWRHVPTVFRKLPDGLVEAVFASMLNGIYAVNELNVSFTDMAKHWAKHAVETLASNRILSGVGKGSFEPNRAVTRAEFAAMLVEAFGLPYDSGAKPAFHDVDSAAWYGRAVGAASEAGLITGYADGSFHPNERITREQMLVMLMRAYRLTNAKDAASDEADASDALSGFRDGASVSSWAADDVQQALALKLVQGRAAGEFAPQSQATRGEAAMMLYNALLALAFVSNE